NDVLRTEDFEELFPNAYEIDIYPLNPNSTGPHFGCSSDATLKEISTNVGIFPSLVDGVYDYTLSVPAGVTTGVLLIPIASDDKASIIFNGVLMTPDEIPPAQFIHLGFFVCVSC